MLIPCVISPTIFNFSKFSTDFEQDLKIRNIIFLLNLIKSRGIILFDDNEFLRSEIKQNIDDIKNDNLKKKLKSILVNLFSNFKINQVSINPVSSDILQYCQYFVSLTLTNNAIGIFCNADCEENCETCLGEKFTLKYFKTLNWCETEECFDFFNKKSIVSSTEIEADYLKDNVFKNFIKFSKELLIYDKQLTPDNNNQNRGTEQFKIPENFKYNLNYWLKYFYEINPSLDIKIIISIKINQINIKQDIYDSFEQLRKEILLECPNIQLSFKYIKERTLLDKNINFLHQRYFSTEKMILSCDRGLDLLKKHENIVRDFNISIVEPPDEIELRNIFNEFEQT